MERRSSVGRVVRWELAFMVLLSVLVICFGGCWIRADLGVDIESSMYDIALVYCLKSPGGKSSIFSGGVGCCCS
jgi:hypothetical protein